MAQQSLIVTAEQDGQALEISGRRLSDSHEQIRAILRSRLGHAHADLLANGAGEAGAAGSVRWTTELSGAERRAVPCRHIGR